jgi:N6-L-threonylcarbamoyladenine synthase
MGSDFRILGIETSCDETAIGVVVNGREILSNVVSSSLDLHAPYGGVIPEIAARLHAETIWDVLSRALEEARLRPEELDAIAVTQGPGLPGALLVGLAFAKGLALTLERPLIPVDHLAAHHDAGEMTDAALEPPYIGLVVSGGHTLLCVAHGECRYEVLGETRDDAVGEAFDKVAKLLGLGYPGGPVIDRLSEEGCSSAVAFPRGHTKQPFDFSFSGLKTAVYQYVQKHAESLQTADVAASFQEAAVEMLTVKTLRACQRTGIKRVVVGGGVASNRRLRARFAQLAEQQKLQVVFPPPTLCVDNGAMVAGVGFPLLQRGRVAPLAITTDSNLCLV